MAWPIHESLKTPVVAVHLLGFKIKLPGLAAINAVASADSFSPARERLARLKSHLNLKLVHKYRDRRGVPKVQGGPHLTASGVYPINLGLKAGLCFVILPKSFDFN